MHRLNGLPNYLKVLTYNMRVPRHTPSDTPVVHEPLLHSEVCQFSAVEGYNAELLFRPQNSPLVLLETANRVDGRYSTVTPPVPSLDGLE